jgi:uncharacterized protein YukE
MAQLGGNLEQLSALRATLQQQGQLLEQVAGTIRNQLSATEWHGPAAERFREGWANDFEPSLRRLQGALQEAGAEIGRRRDALAQAGT